MKNNIKLFTTNTKTQDGRQKHDIPHRQLHLLLSVHTTVRRFLFPGIRPKMPFPSQMKKKWGRQSKKYEPWAIGGGEKGGQRNYDITKEEQAKKKKMRKRGQG